MRTEKNTIFSLMNSEGNIVEVTEKISDVIYNFYGNLYTKEFEYENTQNEFLKEVTVKLNEEERELLDNDFTIDELKDSMNDLKKNKSPGSDGLTKEFYDYFGDFLYPAIHGLCKRNRRIKQSDRLPKIRSYSNFL